MSLMRAESVELTATQFSLAYPVRRIANWGLFCQAKGLPEAITVRHRKCCAREAHQQPKYDRFGDQTMRRT
jgi:hypothetical protein